MREPLIKAIEAILLEIYTVPNQDCSDHLKDLKTKLEKAEKLANKGQMVVSLEAIIGDKQ